MTPRAPLANPSQPRTGQNPDAFQDEEAEALLVLKRDQRTGVWITEGDAPAYYARENGGRLYVFRGRGNGHEDRDEGRPVTAPDPRSADRRRAGDRLLADPGAAHFSDSSVQIAALKSWQQQLDAHYRREG